MNFKLAYLARKFAQKLNEQPDGVADVPSPAQENAVTFDAKLQEAGVESDYITYLKNKQYWLLPWETVNQIRDVIKNMSPITNALENLGNELQEHMLQRSKSLFNAVGRVITDAGFISRVQQALIKDNRNIGAWGPKKDGVDGKWGAQSAGGLLEFQNAHSLDATATLTNETFQALFYSQLHQ